MVGNGEGGAGEGGSGASRVVVFDHTLRTADDELRETRKIREVVRRVHNDYTEWSGPQRVRDLLPDEADDLLRRRFAIIQVWRPIRHPVESFPLAICDARSISPDDFVISERRYPNRIGQTYAITYNPEHRWYWLRACGATRRWCSRSMIRRRTAAPAGPRTPRSRTRPRRPTHGRARASRSAPWHSSEPRAGRSLVRLDWMLGQVCQQQLVEALRSLVGDEVADPPAGPRTDRGRTRSRGCPRRRRARRCRRRPPTRRASER